MRSIIRLLLVVLGCVALARAGWQLTFADEFNGQTVLNATSWKTSYSFAPVTINGELQFYSPGGFTFGSDYLRIVGEKKSVNGFQYQSGLITTNGRFVQTFGYFEMRARWMSGRGLWPAFWLYGQYGSISGSTEIDVLEALLQNPEIAYLTYHCKNKTAASTTYTGNELADQSWHTYSVQWNPNIIIWYIDGIQRFNTTYCVPDYPMFILANMAIGGSWPGAPNATTPFPAYMDVDYIRAYKYVSSGGVSLTGPGQGLAFTMPTLPTLPTITFGGSPMVTPNNVNRGDNVTFTFTVTVRGTAPLVTPMVAMYVQPFMNNSVNLVSRTTGLSTMAVGATHTVSFTVTIPDTFDDGYYRVVFGVWNNTWTTNVFWQDSVAELGINSIVGGREMPVVPITSSTPSGSSNPSPPSPSSTPSGSSNPSPSSPSSTPSGSSNPSPSSPSTQSPSVHLNSAASIVGFEKIVLVLSFVLACTLI